MEKVLTIDSVKQIVTTKNGSTVFHKCECVTGNVFNDTPKGKNFKIERKYRKYTSIKYKTRMDYAMFFTTIEEALHQYHGSVPWSLMRAGKALLGSHGCVRLQEADAKKLYDWTEERKTKVHVI